MTETKESEVGSGIRCGYTPSVTPMEPWHLVVRWRARGILWCAGTTVMLARLTMRLIGRHWRSISMLTMTAMPMLPDCISWSQRWSVPNQILMWMPCLVAGRWVWQCGKIPRHFSFSRNPCLYSVGETITHPLSKLNRVKGIANKVCFLSYRRKYRICLRTCSCWLNEQISIWFAIKS